VAEDLTQEVFLRIYRSRAKYEPGAKFATWIFTIAGNVARNAARSHGRRKEVIEADTRRGRDDSEGNLLTKMALDASGLMPARLVEGEERAELVRQAVDKLGERQRMALMLSRFENMSYVEIAEAMDLTSKAVKSLLSRARVNLRDALAEYIDMSGAKEIDDETE
jgi:RNA polymerase sigma-70 factor (ECF subfamily)